MLDPFPVPAPLRHGLSPLTDLLHLHTLPLHIHQVFLSYVFYNIVNAVVSPRFSSYLFPRTYGTFSPFTRIQWDMHVTSLVNSTLVSIAAIYVIYADQDRLYQTWEERIWGYTGLGGMVQAMGAGYFVWDVQVCALKTKVLGIMGLVHAIVALTIAMLGFVHPERQSSRYAHLTLL